LGGEKVIVDITKAIDFHYPGHSSDYNISTDVYGVQHIIYWGLPDPVPSDSDLQAWWLDYLRSQKKAEIANECEATLSGGYSYADVQKSFPVDPQSWALVLGEYAFLQANENATPQALTATDGSVVTLTRDQFFALVAGARDFVGRAQQKVRDLYAQIDQASTEDAVNAITWS
jgi:hypothetical protein